MSSSPAEAERRSSLAHRLEIPRLEQTEPYSPFPFQERYLWFVPPPGGRVVSARRDRLIDCLVYGSLAAVLAVAGFAGGAYVKLTGAGTTNLGAGPTSDQAGALATVSSRSGGDAVAGTAGNGDERLTGTVKLIDGTTVYVEDDQGHLIRVTTNDQTAVLQTSPADLAAVGAGGDVIVTGDVGPDGSLAASTITTPTAATAG